MLIIAPIIIIFIGIMIVMITSITGESLQARERNTMAYQVQDALDLVETESGRSATYPTTTGTLTSPQGSNGSTAAFTVTNNDASSTDNDVLIIKTPATSSSPVNATRDLIYYNSPNACASAQVSQNDYYPVTTVYFVSSGSLWQRTILPSSGTPCSTPWQRGSCAESAPLTGVCKTYDNKLVSDVTSFSVQYLKADGTALAAASAATAKSVNITVTTSKLVAGKTIAFAGSTRSTTASGGSGGGSVIGTNVATFNYTGNSQTWQVPSDITLIQLECWGAQAAGNTNGLGGYAKGNLTVTPAQNLTIYVGGQSTSQATGGYNGGGNGGTIGSSGGGSSDVRANGTALTNRVIVCGGGGGAGFNGVTGGDGGGSSGATGGIYNSDSATAGGGGTQSAGGNGGLYFQYVGSAGSLGAGGNGDTAYGGYGGGGGGGYYGGGGGGVGGGGGGSSYIGGVIGGITTAGLRTGNGQVKITY